MVHAVVDEMSGTHVPVVDPHYAVGDHDEAFSRIGGRPDYLRVLESLQAWGAEGATERARRLAAIREEQGVVFTAVVDGRAQDQLFPMDVMPRVVPAAAWGHVSAGVAQRVRALNAFLADVYEEPGRTPAIVAAGAVPAWLVRDSPGLRSEWAGLAAVTGARAAVAGLDLLLDADGTWRVLEDNLRVPSGIAYALANRRTARLALPEFHQDPERLHTPEDAPALLRAALVAAAPAGCGEAPQLVVLSDGPGNSAWYEHRVLAAELGVPVVVPADLRRDKAGVVATVRAGDLATDVRVDVAYRRMDEDDAAGQPTADGTPLGELLLEAVRDGVLGLVNAPGNGVADDKATYRAVPDMIRFYLGEEPVLADVETWVLADAEQYGQVRGRLGEYVVKPVDGYGGNGVRFGPTLSREDLAALEAEVAAAPHRFVAQRPVRFSTHPTLVDGRLEPRHVDLRVFAFATGPDDVVVAPCPLTRVASGAGELVVNSSQGGGSKDTWVLSGR